jgi:hypothetical protein
VGPRDDVAELDWVFAMPVDLSERKDAFSQTVQLRPPKERNVRLDRSEVEITVVLRPKPEPKPETKINDKCEDQADNPACKKPVKPANPKMPASN